jgi:gliding motility-associated-like protein
MLTTMPDTTICSGDATPLRAVTNAPSIKWIPENILDNPSSFTPIATVTENTLVIAQASISQCQATDQFTIRPVPYPIAVAGPGGNICANGQGIVLQATASSTANLRWTPDAGLSNSRALNPTARPAATTTYILSVLENNGCPKPGTDTLTIQVAQPIVLTVPPDTSIVVGQPLQLRVGGAARYLWTPSAGLSNPTISDPTFTYNQPQERITLRVTGYNGGCEATETINIRVFAGPAVYMPTAFTPNGDGLNDVLTPILVGMKRLVYFRLYNRYGQLLFETTEEGKGWNGIFKGQLQPPTNYVWGVQAIDYKSEIYNLKGTVMLIR